MASALALSAGEWDFYTGASLLGMMTHVTNAGFDDYADGTNEISFGNYGQSRVIAVCRMWVTRGAPSKRQIVEFDTDFVWGDASLDSSLMGLQNIATHELGHGIAGLGDIYQDKWSYLTMYGYSSEGDIAKRTIEGTITTGDIGGVRANYGS